MLNKVGWVVVYVSDMDRAVRFYADTLGMGVRNRSSEFPEFVELATEGTILSLNSGPEAKGLIGRPTGITLTLSDMEGTYSSLSEQGVRFSGSPTKQPWGGVMTSLFDPDGNEISLLEIPQG